MKKTLAVLFLAAVSAAASANRPLTLHYDRPAEFFEEALVIGNGKIGATVYGGVQTDRLSLNDITFWTGKNTPEPVDPKMPGNVARVRALLDAGDYAGAEKANMALQGPYVESYQPLGNLIIRHKNVENPGNYRRSLDIGSAVASAGYDTGDGRIEKEYFASSPDSVIAVRIKAGKGRRLDFSLEFNSQVRHQVSAAGNRLVARGYAAYHTFPVYFNEIPDSLKNQYDPERGTRFMTIVSVDAPGSEIRAHDGRLDVKGGKEAVILISNETSFNGAEKDPATEGKDYAGIVERTSRKAAAKSYDRLKKDHVADYRRFFDRVSLDLGTTPDSIAALPTDVQLKRYSAGEKNPQLEELYYQFGRYLLISCSRTPGVPPNLQGLWNEKLFPPWSCDYTTNINLQENFWGAENSNLSEMHQPLMDFIASVAISGSKTAKEYYGVDRGWMLSHNSDIWAQTNPVGLGKGSPSWADWNMGGAWVASHIWQHYLFTLDTDFLRNYYPYLKGAAEFCLGWMIEKDGHLMTSPGTSPENQFRIDGRSLATSYGTTSDLAMIRECVGDAVAAARVLGTDPDFISEGETAIARLAPYKIGKKGSLQEWYHDFEESEPTHRHQSHLYGLFPGTHISPVTDPEIAAACHKTLELRGPKTTGWSTGWRVNLYARLLDSKMAYTMYRTLLKYVSPDDYRGEDAVRGGGTYPNLLDAHSPFQIDGNFGGSAGVAEMLLQSHGNSIVLLPALPEEWKDGSVKGLRARGAYTVDIDWKDGKVSEARISSDKGGNPALTVNGRKIQLNLSPGESRVIKGE